MGGVAQGPCFMNLTSRFIVFPALKKRLERNRHSAHLFCNSNSCL